MTNKISITKEDAEKLIVKEKTFYDNEMAITIVMAELQNGHRVIGTAIVTNKESFDKERGYNVAKRRMVSEIIKHEVYLMKSKNKEGETNECN